MSNGSLHIVQKLWNYCNILRDDGLSYGDYVEKLTYLLLTQSLPLLRPFGLRSAQSVSLASRRLGSSQDGGRAESAVVQPFNRASPSPKGFGWDVLLKLDGDDLEPSGANRRSPRKLSLLHRGK